MKTVFLDTVGLIALWDQTDQWHESAEVAMARLIASKHRFFSSELVMMECGNSAARRPFRDSVLRMRQSLLDRDRLVFAHHEEMKSALRAYAKREAAGAGIVDQISFILMRRLGITEAFTNDEHFRSAGFVTLF